MLPLPAAPDAVLVDPMLVWCISGEARVRTGRAEHRVPSGMALWLPRGLRVRVMLESADVVLPVAGVTCGDASSPVTVVVPAAWEPWLLHAFGESLAYLDGTSSRELLSRLLRAATPHPAVIARPTLPSTPALLALAGAIDAAPAVPVPELVRQGLPGWTARTLQRRFAAETGLAPEAWARRHRIALAAEMLANGDEVQAVAHRVGYATSAAFSRRFREVSGVVPGRWRESVVASSVPLLRPASPPPGATLPPHRTWLRSNGAHVAVWAAQGSAAIRVGDQEMALAEGQAIVIPAGVPNSIRLPRAALLLPVGYRSGRDVAVGMVGAPATVRPEEAHGMIQAMVAAYTTVRPAAVDPLAGFTRVLRDSTPTPPDDVDALISSLASAIATGDVEGETLADCARWAGVGERELSRIVNARVGLTFAQWIRVSRMSRARVQLHGGAAASAVSRRLGYAHLPAFSRAFREVHGTSPRAVPVVNQHAARSA